MAGLLLVYAPDPAVLRWVQEEIDDQRTTFYVVREMAELIWALTQDVPPRPQILVADFDSMSPGEVLELHSARERWFGSIIALGAVTDDLKASLNIEYVLGRPLGSETLRKAIGQVGLDRPTTKMPKLVP